LTRVSEDRRTFELVAPADLSRQVEAYYRDYFRRRVALRADFERALELAGEDLAELARQGADPGFVLHALIAAKHVVVPEIERSEPLRRLKPKQRAALVAAARTIRGLGEADVREIFGTSADAEQWAKAFWWGAVHLDHLLTSSAVEAPAFAFSTQAKPGKRRAQQPLTAAIVCAMDALKDHPKRAEAVAVLLEKFGLIQQHRAGPAAVEFVKKRARRATSSAGVRRWLRDVHESYEWLTRWLTLSGGASPCGADGAEGMRPPTRRRRRER